MRIELRSALIVTDQRCTANQSTPRSGGRRCDPHEPAPPAQRVVWCHAGGGRCAAGGFLSAQANNVPSTMISHWRFRIPDVQLKHLPLGDVGVNAPAAQDGGSGGCPL